MLHKLITTLCLCLYLSLGTALPVAAENWLLAAAACPPWKEVKDDPEATLAMAGACRTDADLMVAGLSARFSFGTDRIISLIDEQAITSNVTAAMRQLAQDVDSDDRVFFYINTHGGALDSTYKGHPVKDEVLAFYTETEPQDFTQATANGDWMTVRDFRDLMNQILGEEVILILEACHADFALEDFMANVHHGIGGRGEDWPGREAVIFSSHAEQVANFLPDKSAAVFTSSFADSLKSGQHDTLFESFEAARLHTHRQIRESCAEDTSRKALLQDWSTYKLICTQMPTAWDPFGLLDDIALEPAAFGAL